MQHTSSNEQNSKTPNARPLSALLQQLLVVCWHAATAADLLALLVVFEDKPEDARGVPSVGSAILVAQPPHWRQQPAGDPLTAYRIQR